ncbi:MAG: hypothetical protein LH468_00655 [Nocardioides sp.]|nr:hypothetical protein [Nocardioides sp.]
MLRQGTHEREQMPKKQASKSEVKELRAEVKRLKASLKKAEARAARWKDEAAGHRSAAAKVVGKVAKLERKLAKTVGGAVEKVVAEQVATLPGLPPGKPDTAERDTAANVAAAKSTAPKAPAAKAPAARSSTAKAPGTARSPKPDASWTVPQLRQEARAREVAYSGQTKAQLVALLG